MGIEELAEELRNIARYIRSRNMPETENLLLYAAKTMEDLSEKAAHESRHKSAGFLLPCNIGEKVWVTTRNKAIEGTVSQYRITEDSFYVGIEMEDRYGLSWFQGSDFGKTILLTNPAAKETNIPDTGKTGTDREIADNLVGGMSITDIVRELNDMSTNPEFDCLDVARAQAVCARAADILNEYCLGKKHDKNTDERRNIMAKHYVIYRIYGTYTAEVEANDIKEAFAKADIAFSEADFGESANIDGSPAFVEDEAGNPLWEEGNPIPGHEDEYYFCDAEEER